MQVIPDKQHVDHRIDDLFERHCCKCLSILSLYHDADIVPEVCGDLKVAFMCL